MFDINGYRSPSILEPEDKSTIFLSCTLLLLSYGYSVICMGVDLWILIKDILSNEVNATYVLLRPHMVSYSIL